MASDQSLNVPHLHPFTVGDWLVEPKACQMSRGGTSVKLRAQLIDVLVCLARRAGEIVLKDEMLAEVWPGQFVAESGLSRCIAELRQTLQDDAQQPRYIETVTKRGYRLVAPVVWVATQDSGRQEPATSNAETAAPADAATSVDDATSAVTAGTRRGHMLASARRLAWAATGVLALAAGIVATVMLTRTPAKVLTERDTVLLADLKNTTADPMFDDTLRLALAVNLEQAPFLHILPQDAVRAAVALTGRAPDQRVVGSLALEVCRREGAAVLLAGSIGMLGSRYVIGIETIACGSGETIARTLVEADRKERVLGALEQAATHIRQRLGESRESLQQHDVPLERATTPSLEALKALTLGDRNRDQAHLAEAMTLYRQAIDLDPDFALAWARLGAVARNLGLREEMMPAFRRAYELRDRVSQPERFYIEAHYVFETNPERAIEIYQAWKRMYPGSVIPPNNLAGVLSGTMGRYDAALPEAKEAVRLAPRSSIARRNLVTAYLGTGRIAEARQALADATTRGIDDTLMRRLRLKMAFLDSDPAAIERETRRAAADPMTELYALRLGASAAMSSGRLREARRLWSAAITRATDVGSAGLAAGMRLYQAEAEALLGDPRVARELVVAALGAAPNPVTQVASATVFAVIGEPGRARVVLDDIARQPVPDPGPLRASLPATRALVEAMYGGSDNAIGILQPAARFVHGSDFELVPLGISALVEMHARRPSNAAVAFRELIQLRALEPTSPWVAFAPLGLARALSESGDKAGSLAAYNAFLESWKDADRDAALLAVARRERAAIAGR